MKYLFVSILMSLLSYNSVAAISSKSARINQVKNYQTYKHYVWEEYTEHEIIDQYNYRIHAFNNTLNRELNFEVQFYRSKVKGKRPLVIQLPPIGNQKQANMILAKYYAEIGYDVLVVPPATAPTGEQTEIDSFGPFMLANTEIVMQSLDLIFDMFKTQIDTENITSFGISLGSMRNLYLLAFDSRVKAGVSIMAGSDLEYIVSYSTLEEVVNWRRKVMQQHGIKSQAELEVVLRSFDWVGPEDLIPYLKNKKVALALALFDSVVPTEKQKELSQLLKDQVVMEKSYYTSHIGLVANYCSVMDFSLQVTSRLTQGPANPGYAYCLQSVYRYISGDVSQN